LESGIKNASVIHPVQKAHLQSIDCYLVFKIKRERRYTGTTKLLKDIGHKSDTLITEQKRND